jgi:hypothetical protein
MEKWNLGPGMQFDSYYSCSFNSCMIRNFEKG